MAKFEIGDLVCRKKNQLYTLKIIFIEELNIIGVREIKYGDSSMKFRFNEEELVMLPLTRKIILEKTEKWKQKEYQNK